MAEKKALSYEVSRIKKFNQLQKNKEDRIHFTVKGKQLLVENELHVQNVFPPTPLELFVSNQEQQEMDKIEFAISQPKTEGGSIFVGLAAHVAAIADVNRAYRKVRQLYPSYDHAMMAYRIPDFSGYQDDGEHSAGIKLHALLFEKREKQTALFVVQNFGGSHLGPRRFDYIQQVALSALKNLQHLENDKILDQAPQHQQEQSRLSRATSNHSINSNRSVGSRSSYNSANPEAPSLRNSPTRASQPMFPEVRPEFPNVEDWTTPGEPTSKQMDGTVIAATQI